MLHKLSKKEIIIKVNDFPFLKPYANRIVENCRSKSFLARFGIGEKRRLRVISYFFISNLDTFWFEVLGRIGFCYFVNRRAFYFGFSWERALKFVKELERRGYLEKA